MKELSRGHRSRRSILRSESSEYSGDSESESNSEAGEANQVDLGARNVADYGGMSVADGDTVCIQMDVSASTETASTAKPFEVSGNRRSDLDDGGTVLTTTLPHSVSFDGSFGLTTTHFSLIQAKLEDCAK